MLHIIFLILKIIGIILLCILGIVLTAVSCVLFIPLRYRIEVFREEGEDKPPVSVQVKFTWLLHLVNVLLRYPAEVYVRARIFLFTVFRMPEKKKKRNRGGKHENAGKAEWDARAVPEAEETEQAEPAGRENVEDAAAMEAEGTGPAQEQEPFSLIGRLLGKIQKFIDKIKEIIQKIKSAFENIRYTIRHFCDKIRFTLDNIQYYREVMESEAFKGSWSLCRKQVGALLKEIKPDRFEADLIIGTGDPAITGEILAACGMLYPLMGQNVRVVGDFERTHIEGYVYMKGSIHVFPFLYAAAKVYWNKDVRTLIKLFKKEAV